MRLAASPSVDLWQTTGETGRMKCLFWRMLRDFFHIRDLEEECDDRRAIVFINPGD